jgi:hypothetical protein
MSEPRKSLSFGDKVHVTCTPNLSLLTSDGNMSGAIYCLHHNLLVESNRATNLEYIHKSLLRVGMHTLVAGAVVSFKRDLSIFL